MPSKAATKLLERMRRSKTGWKRNDLEKLYLGFGFIIKPGGSHDLVSHPDFPEIVTAVPRHVKVHEYIVTQALKNIDRLIKLQDERGESDGEE